MSPFTENKQHVVTSKYVPYAYIEGVLFPVIKAQTTFSSQEISAVSIGLIIPYDPDLWPPYWSVEPADQAIRDWQANEVAAVAGTTHDNGLEYKYNVSLHGIQEGTMVHLFIVNEMTGEDMWVAEGKIKTIQKIKTDKQSYIQVMAYSSMQDIIELHLAMADLARATGTTSDWDTTLGTASVSSIVSRFNEQSLATAFTSLLNDSALNTDFYHHLHWRMRKIDQRLHAVDNPKAMGSFNLSRMKEVLEQTLGELDGDSPLSTAVLKAMDSFMYQCVTIPFPTFLNAKYDENGLSEGKLSTVAVEVDEETDLDIGLADDDKSKFQVNETWFMPDITNSPPPRCNVLFPNQYGEFQGNMDFSKIPTRGIVRVTGEGRLTSATDSSALTLPDGVREGMASNKYYNSPEEHLRGIHMSSFDADKPQAAEDMGKDYMKGYMSQAYEKKRYEGCSHAIGGTSFNPKPVPGFPFLTLSEDGDHMLSYLVAVSHTFNADAPATTSYQVTNARPYYSPTSEAPMILWYEQTMYHQENIGSYIYPRILGRFIEYGITDLSSVEDDDMSILKHIYYDKSLSSDVAEPAKSITEAYDNAVAGVEEDEDEPTELEQAVIAAKRDESAIRRSVDALYALWKQSVEGTINITPEWFATYYGRRPWMGRKHLFEDFYKITEHSEDWFVVGGGYTLATNSCTAVTENLELPEGQETPDGVLIPRDTELRGCFTWEIQQIMIGPAVRIATGMALPGSSSYNAREDISSIVDLESFMPTTEE